MSLLDVEQLSVRAGGVDLVHEVSFGIERGSRVGLIGESGSGKSVTALALMGLLGEELRARGSVRLDGTQVLGLKEKRMAALRGERIAMVFQEPMTALDPLMRVGDQVAEALRLHRKMKVQEARGAAVHLLERVQLPGASQRARAFPHQLSGGQRQRVVIAMALACQPDLLIADEPTTALDVTVQKQVLEVLDALVREENLALLLITHDLPVVSGICDEVLVMYGGRIVERGPMRQVLGDPRHPYTNGLLDAIPGRRDQRLKPIRGVVPAPQDLPSGCVFRDRCPRADEQCQQDPDTFGHGSRSYACWHPLGIDA